MQSLVLFLLCHPSYVAALRETRAVLFERDKTVTKAVVVCWLFNVPVTCLCISGTDLHRQVYVVPF